jgi:hypothetical protein
MENSELEKELEDRKSNISTDKEIEIHAIYNNLYYQIETINENENITNSLNGNIQINPELKNIILSNLEIKTSFKLKEEEIIKILNDDNISFQDVKKEIKEYDHSADQYLNIINEYYKNPLLTENKQIISLYAILKNDSLIEKLKNENTLNSNSNINFESTPGQKFEVGGSLDEKLKLIQSELTPEYPFQQLFTELDNQNVDYKIEIDEHTELITSITYFDNEKQISNIPEELKLTNILSESDYLQEIKYPGTPIDLLPEYSYKEIEAQNEVREIYTEERLKEVYVDKYLHSKEFKEVIKDTILTNDDLIQLKEKGTLDVENLNINGVSVDGKLGIYLNDKNVVQHAVSVDDFRLNSMLDPILNKENLRYDNNSITLVDKDQNFVREVSDFEMRIPDAINSSVITDKEKYEIISNDFVVIPINVNNNLHNIKIRKSEDRIHLNFTDKILLTEKQQNVLNYKPNIIERVTKSSKQKLVKLILNSYGLDVTKNNVKNIKDNINKTLGNNDSILKIQELYFKEFTATIQSLENKQFSEKELSINIDHINGKRSNVLKTDLKTISIQKIGIEDKINLLNQQINTKFFTKELDTKKGMSM